MARPTRLELPGTPLHVIQRGNNRAACFFGEVDRRFYLKCLHEAAVRRNCAMHAYVLMSNHIHLLATPNEPGAVARMLQDVGRRYVRIINTIHGRTGTLWEGRFKSSLVDSESYLMTCHRYIEMNPLRAGLAAEPGAYAWSSHRHYSSGACDKLITEHPVFVGLGSSHAERRAAFCSLFEEQLDAPTLKRIRDAVNTGSALGSEGFLARIEALLGRRVRLPIRGRPPIPSIDNAWPGAESGKLF
jgi:putative transposase